MGRIISSVVVGYVTMFVAVFIVLPAAYLFFGIDGCSKQCSTRNNRSGLRS